MALSAVVASGAAVGAVVEGFKSAKNTMQKILKKDENVAADGIVEGSVEAAEEIVEMMTADEALVKSSNVVEAAAGES